MKFRLVFFEDIYRVLDQISDFPEGSSFRTNLYSLYKNNVFSKKLKFLLKGEF